MCEINKENFREKLPVIKKSLEKAKFISLDLEFSALDPVENITLSLFDNNKERYAKLSKNLQHVIPLQIGITAFHYDDNHESYSGDVFSFYINPPAFGYINRSFFFQASTTHFLCLNNFDFNKFVYLGLPYLNKVDEAELRKNLSTNSLIGESDSVLYTKIADLLKEYHPLVTNWYYSCKEGESLEIADLKKYTNFYEINYFIHKHFRKQFVNLWTYEENHSFYVKKVNSSEFKTLVATCKLDEDLIFNLVGFNHVFKLLTTLRKPIIGHNLLQDLLILINNFECPLPQSYSQFKQITNQLFPIIFDTKSIYYELRSGIPKEKLPKDTSLQNLFEYFKNGLGRHLVTDKSAIENNMEVNSQNKYHDAGWDSFCAGYIFLRMAYFNICKNYPKKKHFVSTELFSGLASFKNRVNLIKGSTSYFKIDGEDPSSTRPPWLIVESLKNEPVDVNDLTSLLSCYGCADVKKFSRTGRRVLVAVDTYRAARDISKSFNANPNFQVKQYSPLKHSRAGQAFLLTAATISGALLFWLTHSMVKKTLR